jgi:anti-sigma factor RsiW
MKCEEREELLNGMVDGQLAAEVRQSLETHLLDCPGCRSRLEALVAQHHELEAAFSPESRFAAALADRVAAR